MKKTRKQKIAELTALQAGKITPADILPERLFVWYVDKEDRYHGLVNGERVIYTEAQRKAFAENFQGKTKHLIHILQPGNDPIL